MIKLFSLNRGDRFTLDDKEYTVRCYRYKFMPKIGKTLNIVCFDNQGKTSCFIRNWDVMKEITKGG